MIPGAHVKCSVPECYRHMNVETAEWWKSQGRKPVCMAHKNLKTEDIERMYGKSTSGNERMG